MYRFLLVAFLFCFHAAASAQAPVSDHPDVEIREVARLPQIDDQHPVRIARDPVEGQLYVLMTSGRIYRLRPNADGSFTPETGLTPADHATPEPVGMTFAEDGRLFLLGNQNVGNDRTQFVLRSGERSGAAWSWSTVATSEPYLLSRTWFDHKANGLAISPDQTTLYVNSGARTDHGEMYDGVREEGLTALILQIPADGADLALANDREALRDGGYVFAEGIRNSFDLEFAPNGDLLAADNAGDRDDAEELNWLREGHHYGFPWRIGTSETPQQFAGYDPDQDPFVQPDRNTFNQSDLGWYFSDDPTFPEPPEGVVFTDPIPNRGPFADRFRSPSTGQVLDASEENTTVGTFTPHRSPLGLVFDADSLLVDEFRGGAFILSWNSASDQLLGRLGGTGEDLLFLDLDKSSGDYALSATRIAYGFDHPIDAVIVGATIYVIEYGNPYSPGGRRAVQAVTLPTGSGTPVEAPPQLADNRMSIYPNPASEAIHVEYALAAGSGRVAVELIDMLGRVVRSKEAVSAHGSVLISTDALLSGLYFVSLSAGTVRLAEPVTVIR